MTKWKDLIPPSEQVILASNGNFFEFVDGKEKLQLGFLVLTKKNIYLIHQKGLAMGVAKLHAAIPL
ncbi:MAG: hypothetical protein AABX01_08035, partial [Candidatus Micrarchaeota archaeon]